MNQNDLVALGLSVLVIGGLAVFGPKLGEQRRLLPPTPNPNERPTPPGSDPQYEAARRTIEALGVALQAQGGGTQAQREQMAQVLDAQAATPGQSPAAAALLRQAAQQLRSGQLPTVPPSPNPAPAPAPFPFPFPPATAPAPGGAAPTAPPAPPPSADVLRARDAIRSAERQIAEAPSPASRQAISSRLMASRADYQDAAAVEEIRAAAARIASGSGTAATAGTGQTAPSAANLMARYTELRDHCADYLQGARAIDAATLGAADRTSADLQRAGDMNRAADLGALATASYARAGIARPVAVQA